MNLDKILVDSRQHRNGVYPQIEIIDKRPKTAIVRISPDETEVWTIYLLLPTIFEQCLVDDNWYVVKGVQPEEQ